MELYIMVGVRSYTMWVKRNAGLRAIRSAGREMLRGLGAKHGVVYDNLALTHEVCEVRVAD